jgi:hypothetical protein
MLISGGRLNIRLLGGRIGFDLSGAPGSDD